MRAIIDRFEGELAVIELDEQMYNVPRALFPEAQEGDTVEITVLGKVQSESEELPRAIFERLRKRSRKQDKKQRTSKKPTASESDTKAEETDSLSP